MSCGFSFGRVISKALATAHETLRRARRGELFYAQSLLEELRVYMLRIEDWTRALNPVTAADLKLDNRVSDRLDSTLRLSYVGLD
jgi:hypothetical protein